MDTADDLVVTQLRKLREGAGLTPGRLEASGAVMSALGTSDPQEAYKRLVTALERLGDSERARALKVDYGLDLPRLFNREPVTRETEWLGDRRSGYGQVIGRDSKTLSRWSDKAVLELRALLLNDTFNGHLFVMAAVKGDRILGCTVIQQEGEQADITKRSSLDVDNPSAEPSLPCLIYAYPRDWRPKSLTLGVAFQDEPYPEYVCAIVADSVFSLAFGEERYKLPLNKDMAVCKFERPRRDRLYAIHWDHDWGG